MNKKIIWLVMAAFLVVGSTTAQEANEDAVEERYGHLEKGKSGFRETWVNPNTDWSKFDKLYLWEAEFQYRDVGPARRTRSTMMNTRQREFGILEEDRQRFEEAVSGAFIKELQQAKNFTIADEIGPGTLILRGAALDIISRVPPETIGRSEVYVSNMGEATLVLELIDASDGEVAAIVAERRVIQSGRGQIDEFSMPANRVTVFAEVRRWATRAARKFREELDKAIASG